jgi:hypothetical protein
VIEQVTKELAKLSENAKHLAEYVEDQSQQTEPKTASDLHNVDEWTFADLHTISRLVADNMLIVKGIVENIPTVDESIQNLEKSLKKRTYSKVILTLSGSEKVGNRSVCSSNQGP